MHVIFPRIHRWRVVSSRGTCYRHTSSSAGSLANKRNHVRTVRYDVLYLFIDHLQNVHTYKYARDHRLRLVQKQVEEHIHDLI